MSDIDERRARLAREQAQLDAEARNRQWAEEALALFSRAEKERLLRYLAQWRVTQPGHDADCNCGECD